MNNSLDAPNHVCLNFTDSGLKSLDIALTYTLFGVDPVIKIERQAEHPAIKKQIIFG